MQETTPRAPIAGVELTTDGALDRLRALEAQERIATIIRMRRSFAFGIPAWISFGALDWLVVTFIEPGRLLWYWGLRAAFLPFGLFGYYTTRSGTTASLRFLDLLDTSVYLFAAELIALMSLEYRGLETPYTAGIQIVMIARSAFRPQRWRAALLPNVGLAATYPLTILVAAFFSAPIREQMGDPQAVMSFVQNLFFLLGTAGLAMAGSHVLWAMRRELFEARNVGKYKLRRRLGVGGMGEVWAAYHAGLRREVAVKILHPDSSGDPSAVSRFEREVESLTELTHPNTVRVFDYGVTEDGLWYYAMELLDGQTFQALVRADGPLDPTRAVHLISQASRSLAEAHAHGIIHRDVKPANLFVMNAGGEIDFVKVLDFGIAKRTTHDGGLTQAGTVAGTPAYISPEVVTGDDADARSDVYALGAVLYFLLAGKPPFESDQSMSVLMAQVSDKPVRPSEKRGAPLPEPIERVVLRCLEKSPDARYADAGALAAALVELGLAVPSLPPSPRSLAPR